MVADTEPLVEWSEALSRLDRALEGPLPGGAAHARMAPSPRRGWVPGVVPEGARDAACLFLFFPSDGGSRFVLTLRPAHLARHAGQVSLPGGAVDPGESVEEAALRETAEEVGSDPRSIRVLGALSPLHVPVSGFVMRPIVGAARRRPSFRPLEGEVETILEPAVGEIVDPSRRRRETRRIGGTDYDVPYYDLCSRRVWGATAMVLSEVAWLLDPPARRGGEGEPGSREGNGVTPRPEPCEPLRSPPRAPSR